MQNHTILALCCEHLYPLENTKLFCSRSGWELFIVNSMRYEL